MGDRSKHADKSTANEHEKMSEDYFSGIAEDLQLEILPYLSAREVAKMRRVSQEFHRIVQCNAQVLHNRLAAREIYRLNDGIAALNFGAKRVLDSHNRLVADPNNFFDSLQEWYQTHGVLDTPGSKLHTHQIHAFTMEWMTANGMDPISCITSYGKPTWTKAFYDKTKDLVAPEERDDYERAQYSIDIFVEYASRRAHELIDHFLGGKILKDLGIDPQIGSKPMQPLIDLFHQEGLCPRIIAIAERWQQSTRSACNRAQFDVRLSDLKRIEGRRTKLDSTSAAFEVDVKPKRMVYVISDEHLAEAYKTFDYGDIGYPLHCLLERASLSTLHQEGDPGAEDKMNHGSQGKLRFWPILSPHEDPLFRAALLESAVVWHKEAFELHEETQLCRLTFE